MFVMLECSMFTTFPYLCRTHSLEMGSSTTIPLICQTKSTFLMSKKCTYAPGSSGSRQLHSIEMAQNSRSRCQILGPTRPQPTSTETVNLPFQKNSLSSSRRLVNNAPRSFDQTKFLQPLSGS